MKSRVIFGTMIVLLLAATVASAAVDSAAEFLDIVNQRVERGELAADEALLLKFQYCFDRGKLPADLQPTWKAPMKCATPLIVEYLDSRDGMPSHMTEAIEGYLEPPSEGSRLEYFSESGLFRINYYDTGEHAVPPADHNGNSIPDWVENVAGYMDYCYDYECVTLGFMSPPFAAAGGYMSVYLANLDGVYGFCTPLSNPPGMTRISMDNDFVGFPANDDPDGDALGAAKVTAAHEFKHSTQYIGSFWSEDGWVEVDAVWMEEMAYPETNDYLMYLPFGSPCSDPDQSLDYGSTGTGTYEDCVWELYMSDEYGIDFVWNFWEWRKTHRTQPVMNSYEQIFWDYGTDLRAGWNEFTMWNFACGIRHLVGEGYHEADRYPAGSPQHTVYGYPTTDTGYVAHLAAHFQRLLYVDLPGERIKVTFNGVDGAPLTLAVVVNESYTTHVGAMYMVPLDANNDAEFDVPYDLDGVYSLGCIIGNAEIAGGLKAYSITVDHFTPDPNNAGDTAPVFAIDGNFPNPFNPRTSVKFVLGGTGHTTLDIFDVTGRKVCSLVDQTLDAGLHTIPWSGVDDAGRNLASGTYLAKLCSGDQVATHKLVLAK